MVHLKDNLSVEISFKSVLTLGITVILLSIYHRQLKVAHLSRLVTMEYASPYEITNFLSKNIYSIIPLDTLSYMVSWVTK
jgi:hypothetical protein